VVVDRLADAAYIYLSQENAVARTHTCDPAGVGAQIHLDFDEAGRLVGIEIIGASGVLSTSLLTGANTPRRRDRLKTSILNLIASYGKHRADDR
jgi:uncharacterized protein YuzE